VYRQRPKSGKEETYTRQ